MNHRPTLIAILAVAALAGAPVTLAGPVTFGFDGSVTDDPYGLLGSDFSFSGTYTFDSAAVDVVADAATGVYLSSGSGFGFHSLVAGTAYAIAGSLFVNVANGYPGPVDQYGVLASDGALSLEIFLQDDDAAVFNNDALPLTAPALIDFELAQFRLFGDGIEWLGRVEQLDCLSGCGAATVPEPATGGLLLAALGTLMLSTRRRTRARGIEAGRRDAPSKLES